ncbi:urea amidolyase associated protein UAAP1 [Herbiconiux ginsengi]|uniref:DUF1989 domain-containing protein n=1 Tax=Herbiconiux ginsengi TaxID=381665 RepID=A0A1H3TH10_9MICO|nr:urea amidolyase associated protein UAAP1 [Herbiconiux ginsengi]SDZ49602.1 hypothetical protein SAMN05216554_4234 [Herbiconiux ginsengi]
MSTPRTNHTTNTVLAAQSDARAQGNLLAHVMPYVPADTSPFLPNDVPAMSAVWAETVQGGGYAHRIVARGTRIRFEDVSGDACAHLVLFNADAPRERLNVADTQKVFWQAYPTVGHPLLSGEGRVLATIVSDTSAHHDAFAGPVSSAQAVQRFGAASAESASPSGEALFGLAASKQGLSRRDLPPSVAFFQGVRVESDGQLRFTGSAGPGSIVEILAEMPLILLVANAPHALDPRAEYTVSELRIHAWRDSATTRDHARWRVTPERERAYSNTQDYISSRGIA